MANIVSELADGNWHVDDSLDTAFRTLPDGENVINSFSECVTNSYDKERSIREANECLIKWGVPLRAVDMRMDANEEYCEWKFEESK